MADWATISSLATAGGTLVLAVATFGSVRSANRAARVAERSLMLGLRPLLVPSHFDDRTEKVGFADGKWVKVPGGGGAAEVGDGAIYFAISVRNVGSGIAVLHGWSFYPDRMLGREAGHADPADFHRLGRDLYVPVGDVGFWQGALRDPATDEYASARRAIESRSAMTLDLLYGDHEGGQRLVSRFALLPRSDGDGWMATVARHWHLDTPDPR